MDDRAVALRVVARFQGRRASDWEGKLVGKDFRLTWNYHTWKLEELPQKGKKQLGVATMQTNLGFSYINTSPFIHQNILRDAHIGQSDSYEAVKHKLEKAVQEAGQKVQAENPGQKLDWLSKTTWHEDKVHYLKVMPEGMEPVTAEGKDFNVKVEWTSFKAYSPDSDFQQSDPHYTLYESSSPAAARKMYQMVKADPNVLKSMPWAKFDDWLKSNKIGYKVHFSVWH